MLEIDDKDLDRRLKEYFAENKVGSPNSFQLHYARRGMDFPKSRIEDSMIRLRLGNFNKLPPNQFVTFWEIRQYYTDLRRYYKNYGCEVMLKLAESRFERGIGPYVSARYSRAVSYHFMLRGNYIPKKGPFTIAIDVSKLSLNQVIDQYNKVMANLIRMERFLSRWNPSIEGSPMWRRHNGSPDYFIDPNYRAEPYQILNLFDKDGALGNTPIEFTEPDPDPSDVARSDDLGAEEHAEELA
jgi:hypothetical protein